jgi:hypothetical protein
VRALAGAEQLAGFGVKVRAPLDQLGHADRPLGHQHLGRRTIDQPIAGVDGVFQVERNVLIALHGHGDAALRIVGVGLGHGLLGDHQDLAVARQLDGCAQPSHARSHHQKIDLRRCCHQGSGYHWRAGIMDSMASRNSCPNPVYNYSGAGAGRQSVVQSVSYCSESGLAARVNPFMKGLANPGVVR